MDSVFEKLKTLQHIQTHEEFVVFDGTDVIRPGECCIRTFRSPDGIIHEPNALLVGFIATEQGDFTLSTRGGIFYRYSLEKGQFTYALNGMYAIPLCCIRNMVFNISNTSTVYPVYAFLHTKEVTFLRRRSIVCGNCEFMSSLGTLRYSFPKLVEPIDYKGIKERMDPLKQELMEYFWHPSRISLDMIDT
jgi:hypothetical protein